MKNLFFSLIVFGFLIPSISFGTTHQTTQQEFNNWMQTGSTTGTPTESTTTTTTTTTIRPDLLESFFPEQTTGYQYDPNLSEEDNFILQRREGETASDYINRINIENARRRAMGERPLPDPTVSTTQVPENNGVIRPPLDGPRPPIDLGSGDAAATRQPVSLSDSEILTQLTGGNNFGGGLSGILNQLFYGGLIIAVVLAIFMIIRGGLEYMTIDIASTKEAAKNRIKAAIGGLILCFSTILILNTINPGLTTLQLNFEPIKNLNQLNFEGQELTIIAVNTDGTSTAVGPNGQTYTVGTDGTTVTPATNTPIPAGQSETELRAYFAQNGININKAACIPPNTSCTNVAGLGQSAVLGVVRLKQVTGANIIITGGTEPGHRTHGVGLPIVDLNIGDSRLNNWIRSNATSTSSSSIGTWYTHADGTRYLDETVGVRHWHVVFR